MNLKMEGKRTGPFENLNRPLIDVDQRKSKTIITKSISATTTNISKPICSLRHDHIDNSPQNTLATKTRTIPSKFSYTVDIALRGEPQDVASFFHRPTYQVQISLGTQTDALRIVSCLLFTGERPNFVSKSFLSRQWCKQINPPDYPNLCTATKQTVHRRLIPMIIRIDDLPVCAWFGVVENIAIDVLLSMPFPTAASGAYS